MDGQYLGFDVGTQGTKGVVVDTDRCEVIARADASYDLIPDLPTGAAEQHPRTWLDAVRDVSARLLAAPDVDAAMIRGVGVSGQQHGLVVLDENDGVVRPAKLWCDTSTATEAAELEAELGHVVPTGFTASKIRWMQKHEPENWARVRRVLLPHDYLNYVLTGEATMECGDASGSGFFDPRTRAFREVDLEALDIADKLPPLCAAGLPAGRLDAAGAELLGLPAGVLVSSGGGDNMMSAIGSGATRPGVVVASLGTSGTAFAFADEPVIDPEGLIAPFCDSTGGWMPLLCVMNMTGVTEEVKAAFEGEDDASLTAAAEAVPAGCEGMLLLPYLAGERVPDLPGAAGSLHGLRPGRLRRGHLYRAAIEGTSLAFALGVERMAKLGVQADAVRVVGGGSRNPLWRRVLADALEAPVTRLVEPESAALGGALQALWTARRDAGEDVSADAVAAPFVKTAGEPVDPDPAHFEVYREARARLGALTERIWS